MSKQSIPLAEVFSEPSWSSRYSIFQDTTSGSQMGRSSNPSYPWGFNTLQHVDLRTFCSVTPPSVPENWVATPSQPISLGQDSSFGNLDRFKSSLTGGTYTFTSVAKAVDLTTVANGSLVLSLSSYLPSAVTSASLSLSSDGFATQSTVQFSSSTTPLIAGDSVATWPMSSFTGVDLTKINGVKVTITVSGAFTFYMAALRVIGPQWVQPNIGFDTWNGYLRQPAPLVGPPVPVPTNKTIPPVWYAGIGATADPRPVNARFGVLFYTGTLAGSNSFSLNLRGVQGTDTSQLLISSLTQIQLTGPQPGLVNTAEIPRRMSDLQGLSMGQLEGQSMINLDATAEGVSNTWMALSFTWGVNPSVQISNSLRINPYTWSGSSAPNWSASTWYLAVLELDETIARVRVLNINQTTFQIQGSWASNTLFDTGKVADSYQFIRRAGRVGWNAALNDGSARIKSIRPMALTYAEYQSAALYSNTPVSGASLNVRTSPEMELFTSWAAQSSGMVTAPDTKRTLSGSSTKVTIPGSNSPSVYTLTSNLLSQDAFTGIVDMTKTEIDLSVWFPRVALSSGSILTVSLVAVDNGYTVPLAVPQIIPGQWQQITFEAPQLPSGLYYLTVGCSSSLNPITFWIDNVSVAEKSVSWDARPSPSVPWVPFGDVLNDSTGGVTFPSNGRQLQIRGKAHRQDSAIMSPPEIIPQYATLGKALWPETAAKNINPFTTVLATTTSTLNNGTPYTSIPISPFQNSAILAQNLLGNASLTINYQGQQQTFAYTGGVIANNVTSLPGVTLTPSFTYPPGSTITILGAPWTSSLTSGRSYTFTCSLSVAGNNPPIAYLWTFSDGTQLSGRSVAHTFSPVAAANTSYNVTLTVVDIYGGRSTFSKVLVVA